MYGELTEEPIAASSYTNPFVHKSKVSKLQYVLATLLTLIPLLSGIAVCVYYGHREVQEVDDTEDDFLIKMLIKMGLLNLDNVRFNVWLCAVSFGIIIPQLVFSGIYAIVLEYLLKSKKYLIDVKHKPQLKDFRDVSIIPLGLVLYAIFVQVLKKKSPASFVEMFITVNCLLVALLCMWVRSVIMIMATFPFRFWTTVLFG
jgi:hypothetical protein